MARRMSNRVLRTLWVYAYQIVPAQSDHRLRTIQTLLNHEHGNARRGARVWAGRVLHQRGNTYILIVSDSIRQNREVNRRLEANLKDLKTTFGTTAPISIVDDTVGKSGRPILGIRGTGRGCAY